MSRLFLASSSFYATDFTPANFYDVQREAKSCLSVSVFFVLVSLI